MTELRAPEPLPDTGENPGVVPETELPESDDDAEPVAPTEDKP